jgi:hypothetical protein
MHFHITNVGKFLVAYAAKIFFLLRRQQRRVGKSYEI